LEAYNVGERGKERGKKKEGMEGYPRFLAQSGATGYTV